MARRETRKEKIKRETRLLNRALVVKARGMELQVGYKEIKAFGS
jgi:hypothetical protein